MFISKGHHATTDNDSNILMQYTVYITPFFCIELRPPSNIRLTVIIFNNVIVRFKPTIICLHQIKNIAITNNLLYRNRCFASGCLKQNFRLDYSWNTCHCMFINLYVYMNVHVCNYLFKHILYNNRYV